MIIEVLDGGGLVITKVANVFEPEIEVARYGGVSWREFIPSADEVLAVTSRAKIAATKAEALRRIGLLVPALASEAMLDLIVETVQAGMMNAPTPGSDMETVKDIYVYAKGKMADLRTATQAEVDAYDPATDSSWPV